MGAAVLVGVINGVVVVVGKIDSLIGTLATGFLVQAMVKWRTGSRNVSGVELSGSFTNIAQKAFGGLTLPVLYALILATGHLVRPRAHRDRPADLRHRLQQ